MDITFKNKLKPAKGRILLSDPFSQDDYFHRSVVYICEHSEEETFGFVLNKAVSIHLSDIHKRLPSLESELYLGGPVERHSLFYLHKTSTQIISSQENKIAQDIHYGIDFDELVNVEDLALYRSEEILFFLGYSGWTSGQLDDEISRNYWVVVPCEGWDEIIENKVNLWKYYMEKLGDKFKILANSPQDPNSN